MLANRLAEGLALLAVLDGLLEGGLGDADGARRDVDATDLEAAHHLDESLSFPAAVLGLKRTALAGWLLVALGVLPLLITIIGRSGPVASLTAASVVPLICGIVYLVSDRMASGSQASGNPRAAAA